MKERYPTRPLECWQWAKELRLRHYQDVMTARQQGKLVVTGSIEAFVGLPSGLGEYVFVGGEPWGATIATDPKFAVRCEEAVEARGFARDLCAYMRNYWGSMFLNRSPFGGEFPRPDFCLQIHVCDSHAKWFQVVSEHFKVPYFAIDEFLPPIKGRGEAEAEEYLVGQLHDAVEWMERITGRRYEDERLIQAVYNEYRSASLWAEVCTLNQAVPAPLDHKTMFSLYIIPLLMRHERTSVEFLQALRDEVKERIRDGIAAVPIERKRLLTDSPPPWYYLDLFRYLEAYGCVVVGSYYIFALGGVFRERDDGLLVPVRPLEEQEVTLRSRDDALRALARLYLYSPCHRTFRVPLERIDLVVRMVKQWRCDGMIMHLNRGCEGFAGGQMEVRIALQQEGIPVAYYEGNMGDPREFDQVRAVARIDAFMESLGLQRLKEQ